MKVGLVTTINTNIGDDFIRIGLVGALKAAFPGENFDFITIDKMRPLAALPDGAWLRRLESIESIRRYIQFFLARPFRAVSPSNAFDSCAFVLQCGAPIAFERMGRNAAYAMLWRGLLASHADQGGRVLNFAGGSCFRWIGRDRLELADFDREMLAFMAKTAQHTAVRDDLCRTVFAKAGASVEVIPCSALLAGQVLQPVPPLDAGEYIYFNYMKGGGHYDFGQDIDAGTWQKTIVDLIARLGMRHKVAFLCHSATEGREAEAMGTGIPVFVPTDHADYFRLASKAKAGIFNRMHAAVAHGGLGIPSVAIGNDTRLLMVEHCGLPARFTKDCSTDSLESEIEGLISERTMHRDRLLTLRSSVFDTYVQRFQTFARQ